MVRVEPFFSPPTGTSFVGGVSGTAGLSDFLCPLKSPRLAKTCVRERRPTWGVIVLLRAICGGGFDDQPQAHPIWCRPIHRESQGNHVRSTLREIRRVSRTSLEVYTGIETALTASASVVLMSCTVVDGGFDNVSHRPGFAGDHEITARSRSQMVPIRPLLWLITRVRTSSSSTTVDSVLIACRS